MEVILYGPSQLGPSFPQARIFAIPTFLKMELMALTSPPYYTLI